MTISAKIIADSTANGIRITSVEAYYPRFIHAEELTHRLIYTTPEELVYQAIADSVMYDKDLSRNASSSRAIPVNKVIQAVIDDPAMPAKWFKNKPGMQGTEEIIGAERDELIGRWLEARDDAVKTARLMVEANVHKQHVNRLLEPWAHIRVLMTATNWSNFRALRDHADADPTINALAKAIGAAMDASVPQELKPGEWHLPYIVAQDVVDMIDYLRNTIKLMPTDDRIRERLIKLSVARCARTSYNLHDGNKPSIAKDLELYEKLVGSAPLHASPAEHQATPDHDTGPVVIGWIDNDPKKPQLGPRWENPELHGNFTGWIQYRKTLPNECQ